MSVVIRFQPVRLGSDPTGEEALLGFADDLLIAVLVCVAEGWLIEAGFGPCFGEGRVFPTLGAAEAWLREQISESWATSASAKSAGRVRSFDPAQNL